MENRVKKLRVDNLLTQDQLANKLGITVRMVQYIENGKRKISEDILNKLSNIFNVTQEYILGETNDDIKMFIGIKKEAIDAGIPLQDVVNAAREFIKNKGKI